MGLPDGKVDRLLEDLDRQSEAILYAINDLEDNADVVETPDIRDLINLEGRSILYRIDRYLEPHGLVETEQPVSEGGPAPPKRIWLTDDGREFISLLEDGLGNEIATGAGERIARLEDHLEGLQSEIISLKETVDALEDGSVGGGQGGGDVDQDRVQQQISEIVMDLKEIREDPLLNDDNFRRQLDISRLGVLAFRDLLEDEFGEDRVEDYLDEYRDNVEPLG